MAILCGEVAASGEGGKEKIETYLASYAFKYDADQLGELAALWLEGWERAAETRHRR